MGINRGYRINQVTGMLERDSSEDFEDNYKPMEGATIDQVKQRIEAQEQTKDIIYAVHKALEKPPTKEELEKEKEALLKRISFLTGRLSRNPHNDMEAKINRFCLENAKENLKDIKEQLKSIKS